jgi:CRP-like cAMP-binding protein
VTLLAERPAKTAICAEPAVIFGVRPIRTAPVYARFRGNSDEWTRTQRIRTAAAIPVEAMIFDRAEVPVYLGIAEKAQRLRALGMSDRAIAHALGVTDKTVSKAISRRQTPSRS